VSKGIAIQTILLLLVGIIVVAVLIYFVYSYISNPTLSATDCRARLISYCMTCMNVKWSGSIHFPENLNACTDVLKETYGLVLDTTDANGCSNNAYECCIVGVVGNGNSC